MSNSFFYPKNNHILNHYDKSNGNATVIKAIFWSDGGGEFIFADGGVMSFSNCMETFAIATGASAGPQRPVDLVITSLCLTHYKEKCKAAIAVYNCFSPRPRLISGLVPNNQEELLWRGKTPIESLVISTDPTLFKITRVVVTSSSRGSPIVTVASLSCALKHVVMTLHPSRRVFSVRWPCPVVGSDGAHHVFTTPVDEKGNIKSLLPTEKAIRYVMLEQMFTVLNPPVQWKEMLQVLLYHDSAFRDDQTKYPHLSATALASRPNSSDNDKENDPQAGCAPLPVPRSHILDGDEGKADRVQDVICSGSGQDNASHIGNIVPYRTWVSTLPQVLVFHTSAAHSTIRFPSLYQEDSHAFYATAELQSVTANKQRLHTSLTRMNYRTSGKVGIMVAKGHEDAAEGPTVMWRYDSDDQERTPPAVYWCIGREQWGVMNPAEGTYSAHNTTNNNILRELRVKGCKLPYEYEDDARKMEAEQQRREEQFDAALEGAVEAYVFEDLSVVSACPISSGPSVGSGAGHSCEPSNPFVITHTLAGTFTHHPSDIAGDKDDGPENGNQRIIQNRVQKYHFDPEDDSVKLPCHVISTGVFISKRTMEVGPLSGSPPCTIIGGNTSSREGAGLMANSAARDAFFIPGRISFSQKPVSTTNQQGDTIANCGIMLSPSGRDSGGLDLLSTSDYAASPTITGQDSYPLRLGRYLPSIGASAASISLLHQRHHLAPQMNSRDQRGRCTNGEDTSLIKCSTIVNGVGVFTALCNGVVRGMFDDRCIVTLTPDDMDSEVGLVAHMVSPDATTMQCRVVQCLPNNPLYDYLQYMLPFRRYSKISKEEREAWKDDIRSGGGDNRGLACAQHPSMNDHLSHHKYNTHLSNGDLNNNNTCDVVDHTPTNQTGDVDSGVMYIHDSQLLSHGSVSSTPIYQTTSSHNSASLSHYASGSPHRPHGMNYSSIPSPMGGTGGPIGYLAEATSESRSMGNTYSTPQQIGRSAGTHHSPSGMSDIDMLIFKTRQTLNSAIAATKESNALLKRTEYSTM